MLEEELQARSARSPDDFDLQEAETSELLKFGNFTADEGDARKRRSPVAPLIELTSELLARKHGKFE